MLLYARGGTVNKISEQRKIEVRTGVRQIAHFESLEQFTDTLAVGQQPGDHHHTTECGGYFAGKIHAGQRRRCAATRGCFTQQESG